MMTKKYTRFEKDV